jgi:hypothetical protein
MRRREDDERPRRSRRDQEHRDRWIGFLAIWLLGTFGTPRRAEAVVPSTPPPNPRVAVVMTLQQVRDLAAAVGFPDPVLAAAVAMAESGGNALAVGDSNSSFGLWQIHVPSHPEYNAVQLGDPHYNAAAALAISKHGTDWTPWTTFRTGAYQQYMGNASV